MEMCKVCRDFFEEDEVKIKNGCCNNCNELDIQEKNEKKIEKEIKVNKKNEKFNTLYYGLGIGFTIVFMILLKNLNFETQYLFYIIGIFILIISLYMVKKLFFIIFPLLIAVSFIYGIIYYPLQIISILLFILVIIYLFKK